jgi:hypothetical protein
MRVVTASPVARLAILRLAGCAATRAKTWWLP